MWSPQVEVCCLATRQLRVLPVGMIEQTGADTRDEDHCHLMCVMLRPQTSNRTHAAPFFVQCLGTAFCAWPSSPRIWLRFHVQFDRICLMFAHNQNNNLCDGECCSEMDCKPDGDIPQHRAFWFWTLTDWMLSDVS